MSQHIASISLLVREYDEAISFYVGKLQFELLEDMVLSPTKRWVRVAPQGEGPCSLVLARAVGPEQKARVGNQAGGRVFLFLHTDDFPKSYREMQARGVSFLEKPRDEPYGQVVVFEDLYGNKWDLLQLR